MPDGYIVLHSDTFSGFALLRSSLASHWPKDADVEKSVAYGKQIKIYPLSQAGQPPGATKFYRCLRHPVRCDDPYDARFFDNLNRIVQNEPWLDRDRIMINQLKSIGIEKGQPYNPSPETKESLTAAAKEADVLLSGIYDKDFRC